MAARVVVVGSANTDLVCRVERLPRPGETVTGGRFFEARGGKGANQAVAAARLGAEVTFITRLGDDPYGAQALAGYEGEGIDTRYIARDPKQPSGVALILVDAGGENAIAVAPGANHTMRAADLDAAESAFDEADVVVLQLEIPLAVVAEAVKIGRRQGAQVILNPAPAPADPLPPKLLAQIDVLTPNETEAAQLGGDLGDDDATAAASLRRLGSPTVVLTRGARGALVVTANDCHSIPAPDISPVDTTAAGDAFNGALAVGLAEGMDLPEAVRWACAAGALAACHEGAQPSLPTRRGLDDFLSA